MRNIPAAQWLLLAGIVALPLAAWVVPVEAAKPGETPAAKAAPARPMAAAKRKLVAYAGQAEAPQIKEQGGGHSASHPVDPLAVAAQVDQVILDELKKTASDVAPRCSDEDFLRRVSFDIAGVSPSPQDVTLFGLDPDPHKRSAAIDRLLATPEYADNWARYWRDVIFSRATDQQRAGFVRFPFETWMKAQLAGNKSWRDITTALLTATGDVGEAGETALIFVQQADPKEVAAETSRIFLGIQLQCANCHDHPSDSWKRDQFHSLAAFFPRMRLQPKPQSMGRAFELVSFDAGAGGGGRGDLFRQLKENPAPFIRRFDANGDGKISREEARQGPNNGGFAIRLFELGADADKDGFLTAEEIKKAEPPPMIQRARGSAEYFMPDLQHPQSEGKKLDPVFFLGNLTPGHGLSDLDRRQSLARYITSPDNPWFANAFVNRIWGQLVGEGFYMPIDDIGPERTARYPAALEALSSGFAASGYDIAWLFRAIANTETYQRQIRAADPKRTAVFASAAPVRLRADQLYSALTRVLGIKEEEPPPGAFGPGMGMGFRGRGLRGQIEQLFGFDPSTSPDELTGTIEQALFMMNSPTVNNLIRVGGQFRLKQILSQYKNDDDALTELFLVVHAREPSPKEAQVCRDYLRQVNNRDEAFEDILWSLLNSTEFQTKR